MGKINLRSLYGRIPFDPAAAMSPVSSLNAIEKASFHPQVV